MNIPAESGDMGILSNHVPSIEALRPGLVEVIESQGSQKFFGWLLPRPFSSFTDIPGNAVLVSSGFATVHPNNKLTINVVEAAPLEDFSIEVCSVMSYLNPLILTDLLMKAVRSNLQEALKVAGGNGSEADKMEARIEADVYESIQHALAR